MFDLSYLPPAQLEFIVLADTHYMRDVGDRPLEFESRRKQTARAGHALRLAAELADASTSTFVLHLGDLVQEEPSSDAFDDALQEALAQIRSCGLSPRYVAGNHDIGDKPDATMPTHPVRASDLDRFEQTVGPTWFSFDSGDAHIAVVNSQILNTDLPARHEQRAWLEADLSAAAGRRIFVFFHLPVYLGSPDDPHYGHYDVIAPPDRNWLLDLMREHGIDTFCAAHVHFAFFDRFHESDYRVLPSTSFTRPGFGHMFSAPPAPERGRDDTPKLGFTLFRVREDRTDAHTIRTRGETCDTLGGRIITRQAADLPASPIGITLRRPLFEPHEIPVAYPSLVRQPVRNDYPFLAAEELGIRHLRVDVHDLADPLQSGRLKLLRDRGVSLTATWTVDPTRALSFPDGISLREFDTLELRASGDPRPGAATLTALAEATRRLECPVSLAPIYPYDRVAGKQHARTRVGIAPDQIGKMIEETESAGLHIDRILVQLPVAEDPAPVIGGIDSPVPIDLVMALPGVDDAENAAALAHTILALASVPDARLFAEPFRDFDRTMDIANGLLDPLCNPRPAFEVLRTLNTVLFSAPPDAASTTLKTADVGGRSLLRLEDASRAWTLVSDAAAIDRDALSRYIDSAPDDTRLFDLVGGRSHADSRSEILGTLTSPGAPSLWLLLSDIQAHRNSP